MTKLLPSSSIVCYKLVNLNLNQKLCTSIGHASLRYVNHVTKNGSSRSIRVVRVQTRCALLHSVCYLKAA